MSDTPNLGYPVPDLGDDKGDWAEPLQDVFDLIDADTFTTQSGVNILTDNFSGLSTTTEVLQAFDDTISDNFSGLEARLTSDESTIDSKPDRHEEAFSGTTITVTHSLGSFPIVGTVSNNLVEVTDRSINHSSVDEFVVNFSSISSGIIIAIG